MPTYLDRHELVDSTAERVARAHVLDLETQSRYGVKYVTYFYDYERQTAFCVAEGPNDQAVEAVHRDAHGLLATKIIEIDPRLLELFTGPLPAHEPGEAYLAHNEVMCPDEVHCSPRACAAEPSPAQSWCTNRFVTRSTTSPSLSGRRAS
ncbi:MAG: nickel-binding protein [Chloroflexota bacterium]